MGARQSKRSVDISGTPKKGELENGGVEEGKLERIEEGDLTPKVALNGTTPHLEKEDGSPKTPATEEAAPLVNGDHKVEATPEEEKKEVVAEEKQGEEKKEDDESTTEQKPEETPATTTPDKCEKKKKEKSKKKWSFRSISFSRKDKSKPSVSKDDSKNGDVTIEEQAAEVVEAEAAAVAATVAEAIPVKDDEKKEEAPATPAGEEDKKEEKPVESTETAAPTETTPAPAETPSEPAPAAEAAPTEPAAGEPAPTPAAEAPTVTETPAEPVKEAEPEVAALTPAPVATPAPEATPESTPAEPAIESAPVPASEPATTESTEPAPVEAAPEVTLAPVAAEICSRVLSIDVEEKYEEIPPPLPASPPPAEAPPPTPVAPTPAPAPVEISMLVQLGNDTEAQEIDVAGGGGESMAELPPGVGETVLDVIDKEIETTLVNGVSEDIQQIVSDMSDKVTAVKAILSENTESHMVTESTEIVTATPTSEE